MGITSYSLDDTVRVAACVVGGLKGSVRDTCGCTVFTLSGPLGAGKTAFVKCLAGVLGVSGIVTSPSFIIRHDYDTADDIFPLLIHIDAYRLEDSSEIHQIGWTDILCLSNTLVVVEWPERIAEYIPDDAHSASVQFSGVTRVFKSDLLTKTAYDSLP